MKVRTSLEILWTQGIIKELEKKIKEFKEKDNQRISVNVVSDKTENTSASPKVRKNAAIGQVYGFCCFLFPDGRSTMGLSR